MLQTRIDRQILRLAALRLTVAWCVLAVAVVLFGPLIEKWMLPLIKFAIDFLQPNLDASVRIVRGAHGWIVEVQPLVMQPIPITRHLSLTSATRLPSWSADLFHNLLPATLYLTAVCAWPARHRREWLWRGAASLPVTMLFFLIPAVVLAGHIEAALYIEKVMRLGMSVREPLMLKVWRFLDLGGFWLLPIVAAIACTASVARLCGGSPSLVQPRPTATPTNQVVFPPV